MDAEFGCRASSASLADSLKKSTPEAQPKEAHLELDPVEQLSAELNSISDSPLSDAEEVEAAVDNEPLTIYLKKIRSVQLLTYQQEIETAKLREAGESQIVESVLSTPLALQHVHGLADKLQKHEIRLSDVIEGLTREDDTAEAPDELQFDRREAF